MKEAEIFSNLLINNQQLTRRHIAKDGYLMGINPGHLVVRAATFCPVVRNVGGSSVCELLHVTARVTPRAVSCLCPDAFSLDLLRLFLPQHIP